MIKKALLIFLCLFIGYNITLTLLPPKMGQEVNVDGLNITKAQAYLYDIRNISEKNVLIGTSLTGLIKEGDISADFINLGLDAMTALDGLEIIVQRGEWPKAVFIEANVLDKNANLTFQQFLFNPANKLATQYIPSSRKQNQPIEIFKRGIFELYRLVIPNKGANPNQYNISIDKEVLTQLKSSYNVGFSKERMDAAFSRFLPYYEQLIQNEVKVVFFELPWHPALCPCNRITQIRKAIHERLPANQFDYILQPNCNDYQTMEDGVHLTIASGAKYAAFLKREISNKINNH